jgi:hypothetical protein
MFRSVLPLVALFAGCSEFEILGNSGEAEVDVETTDPLAELTITPAQHDFGEIDIPCTDSIEITLASTGDSPLEIRALDYVSAGLLGLEDGGLQLPLTLEPGTSRTVTVSLTASTPDIDFAQLTVESNDPRGDQTAQQSAEALPNFWSETFDEPGIPPVDILFLIDQSCSMAALAQDNITDGMPDLIDELQSVADWQLIQVTDGDGCANGGVMDANTNNAAGLLSANAFAWTGIDQWHTERLLQHASTALGLTGPGQCNDGFLRQGASLHILIASDEAEQSIAPWTDWVTDYYNFVVSPDLVKVSGVLNVTSNDACSDFNGGSPDGYIDAVNYTNGVAIDICQAGWGAQLTDIATASVEGIRVYNLARLAAAGSVSVLVNGVAAIDFAHSTATNSVTVRDPLVGEGDIVEISYGVFVDCAVE